MIHNLRILLFKFINLVFQITNHFLTIFKFSISDGTQLRFTLSSLHFARFDVVNHVQGIIIHFFQNIFELILLLTNEEGILFLVLYVA